MTGFISKFWEKVHNCKHENLSPNHLVGVPCGTPYCGGWEERCLDCGVYITKCGCGFNNGMSGWPERRWRAIERKKEQVWRKKYAKEN